MKFINLTKNSVYLDDIKTSVPYSNEQPQLIDSQSVKKSYAFQQMVAMGGFRVIEASDERIEQNLLRISSSFKPNEEQLVDRKSSGSKIEVILRGHFYETTGYSKVNRSLALNLYRKGCLVEIDPISFKNNDMNEMEAKVFSMFRRPVGNSAIQIDSVIPTQGKPLKNHYNILYTTSEALSVPEQFIDVSNGYDEIWVTSSFSKRAFEDSGCARKITVVPPILNGNMYKENVLPYSFRPKLKSFVFLSVLTWGYRKGSDALIKAFARSFSDSDDVSLLLLVAEKSKDAQEQIKTEIRKELGSSFSPHVCLCTKPVPEYQLPSFYKACNAFVLPSRGEGFGLPFCEASLCGLPVISTEHGGQLDFLNHENSTLVPIDRLERAKSGSTGVHYWDGLYFPSLSSDDFIDRLGQSMRNMVNNYESQVVKNKLLQQKILQSFSGEVVGCKTKTILEAAWALGKEMPNDSACQSIK